MTGDNVTSPCPSEESWYETIKLNYGYNFLTGAKDFPPRPQLWEIMDQVLAYWQSKGVDGFRCDMAHLIPHEVWEYLIDNARGRGRDPDSFFIAEAYPASAPGAPITGLKAIVFGTLVAVGCQIGEGVSAVAVGLRSRWLGRRLGNEWGLLGAHLSPRSEGCRTPPAWSRPSRQARQELFHFRDARPTDPVVRAHLPRSSVGLPPRPPHD